MILDTAFIVDLMRSDESALALLGDIEAGPDPLHVPSPVIYELWEGIERSEKPIRELDVVEATLEDYPLIELSHGAAKRAGRVSARLIRRGERIGDVDILLAGIALARREAIVTRNEKDFGRVEDLEFVTY